MKPAKVAYTCEECGHEGETRGQCVRHLPLPKDQRPKSYRVRRTKADDIFSKRIRRRDFFTCQRCDKRHEENSQGLHAAHCFGRSRRALYPGFQAHTGWNCCPRHDQDNACALCLHCHTYLDQHDSEKKEFFRERLGDEKFDALASRAEKSTKIVARRDS